MSVNIEFKNRSTGAKENAAGSDQRLDVSSRSDTRRYYNSRDEGQTYVMPWTFNTAASTEYAAYLKNTSTTKTLVVAIAEVFGEVATRFQLDTVTGTAAGTAVTPFNLNTASPFSAECTAVEGLSAGTGITGLTIASKIDTSWVIATGGGDFKVKETLRLKQNEAIAIQVLETAGGDTAGAIHFYFE
jgi:hypothetical protein